MIVWLWIALGLVLAFVIFTIVVSAILFRVLIVKPKFPESNAPISKEQKEMFFKEVECAEKWLEKLNKEEVYIHNQKLKLHGTFLNQNSNKSVIIIHGYGAKIKFRIQDAPFYYNQGFNVLLIDQRVHGLSEGKYVSLGKYESQDLLEWIKWLSAKTNNSKIVLDGVSMGAATVLCASRLDLPANVVFAVSDCSYTTMQELIKATSKRYMLVPNWLLIGLGEGYARRFGKFSLNQDGPIDCVKQAKIPILFIHGTGDKLIPVSMSNELYDACISDKKLVQIPDAGHAFSFTYDRKRCEKEIMGFVEKYINKNSKIKVK